MVDLSGAAIRACLLSVVDRSPALANLQVGDKGRIKPLRDNLTPVHW
jgi:hypothetical protein